jgi:hypothetical protein
VKRAIVLALSVILALVVAAPTVLAQGGNGGAPEDVNVSFDLPAQDPTAPPTDLASLGCDFPLHFVVTGKTKTIELPNGGSILTAPGQNITVTNVDTGEEVTYNITGSQFGSAPDANGIVDYVITGRNLALDPAGVFLNIGRFTFSLMLDENGTPIKIVKPQEGKGQAIDVCALLS